MIAGKQFKGATHRWVGLHKPPVVTHSPLVALDTFTHYCVYIIPQKTDCNIWLIYVCLQARTPQITLHRFPASCLNVSLFAHVHYLSHLHSCGVCIFSLFIGNHLYIYSICIVKADSRLVVYRFILFYFVLYICIHVAPWSSVARHFVPLYVHRCSGMTIKIGRMSVYVKIVTYTWLGDTLRDISGSCLTQLYVT